MVLCGANCVTQRSEFWSERNPRTPPCGVAANTKAVILTVAANTKAVILTVAANTEGTFSRHLYAEEPLELISHRPVHPDSVADTTNAADPSSPRA